MTQVLETPVRRTPKRWTKHEYNDAVDRGIFQRQGVYLYRGELIQMPAMGGLHARGIKQLNYWLVEVFRPDFEIHIQTPFECMDESEPEPDGAVYTKQQENRLPHPNTAVMLVEVSDSSIELDRQMAFDYAAAAVPEYWIIDLIGQQIEVYRQVVNDPTSTTGRRYAERTVHGIGQSVSPLAKPGIFVSVETLVRIT